MGRDVHYRFAPGERQETHTQEQALLLARWRKGGRRKSANCVLTQKSQANQDQGSHSMEQLERLKRTFFEGLAMLSFTGSAVSVLTFEASAAKYVGLRGQSPRTAARMRRGREHSTSSE